jgi:signal transduction histidine kinase/ligand-binding sensor domain-containing protein/DNA-binding response OmpR family regulator
MYQKYRRTWLIGLLLISALLSAGNNRFIHLTIKDGLSQSTIKTICQDSKGFLWMGSADGLNRYDGYKLYVYRNDPSNTASIIDNDIFYIYENPLDSVLWLGTQSEGLNRYNRKDDTFFAFRHDPNNKKSLPDNDIRCILTGSDGKLWIATSGGGICSWNPTDSSFSQPAFCQQPPFQIINSIADNRKGGLWLATSSGLYNYQFTDNTSPKPIDLGMESGAFIQTLLYDIKGNLWVGTRNQGLIKYQPETRKIDRYPLESAQINQTAQRKNGVIYIATTKGLYTYNSLTNVFDLVKNDPYDPESINDDVIYSLFEDRSETLWIGTFLGGVNILNPENSRFEKYRNFLKDNSLSKAINNIKGIYRDQKNTVWVATSKGLFSLQQAYFYDPSKSVGVNLYFKDLDLNNVFGDSHQNIYVSGPNGIFISHNGTSPFQPFQPTLINSPNSIDDFNNAFEDSEGIVWMATSTGLVKYRKESNTIELKNPVNSQGGRSKQNFLAITESYNGKLWLGTSDGLLFLYDRNTENFEEIHVQDAGSERQPYNRIFSICEPSRGSIWFGTNNGLYQYTEKDRKLKRYMSRDGLSNNVIYAVIPDDQGRIWCSTNLGISVLNTQNNSFLNYTWEDGLQSNEFNQTASFKSKDGKIFMGGIDGFNIIDPSQIKPNQYIPPVVITGLIINHEQISPFSHPEIIRHQISEIEELRLKYDQTNFTFQFTALNYILSDKNQYRYKLEGYDKDWVEAGIQRTASYTNIDPGTYTFMVQGSNNDRVWNDQPTLLKIVISPPFWLTWWFKLAVLLFVLLLIYLIFYFRLKEIKNKSKLLEKLVEEKTAALSEKNVHIEQQNMELLRINQQVISRNEKIEQKNHQLNEQNEQIVSQRDNLLALTEQVQKANQDKINFFTTISHEFRTPLTLIIGPLKELITQMDQLSKNEVQRKHKIIYGNACKLLLLVNEVLDFRKADNESVRLKRSSLDLVPFIQQVTFLFNDIAQRKKINFSFLSTQKALVVSVDAEKIEKILFNLISNAFKFTPDQGQISVGIDRIKEAEGNEKFLITVSDSGNGIAEDQISYIFDNFYQADHSQNFQQSGSGLGLTLVKKYAELHGGTIDVVSKPGKGTIFTLTIPIETEELESAHLGIDLARQFQDNKEILISSIAEYPPLLLPDLKTGEKQSFPRVLLVEDDSNLRAYLKEILSANYRIEEAPDAETGIQLADAKHPDLIICDVMLPDFSGFEFCSKVKDEFKTSHIPIILLTALSDLPNQMTGLKSGADAYITKPFDLQYLYLTIENLIHQRRKLQSKFYHGTKLESSELAHHKEDQDFLNKIINLIEENITDTSFDVESLCLMINLSQPQTYRKIKALTDLSISEFIRNIRLKKAAHLLSTTNQAISEVAYEVGFSDPNYFSKCFVKVFGQTPSEFVKLKN